MSLRNELREHIVKRYLKGVEPPGFDEDYDLIANGILDSLALMNLITHVEQTYSIKFGDYDITPENFGSVTALATYIEAQQDVAILSDPEPKTDITPLPRDRDFPLSFGQAELWLRTQTKKLDGVMQVPLWFQFNGQLDISLLEQAFNMLIERHETLRTTFPLQHNQPIQKIAPLLTITLPLIDLSSLSKAEQTDRVNQLFEQEAQTPLDLLNGPLWRVTLIQLTETSYYLLFYAHHIIIDAWSMDIFRYELLTLYRATLKGDSAPLPNLPIQYADFAYWQRQYFTQERLEERLAYYENLIFPLPPPLELPIDKPRKQGKIYPAAAMPFQLSVELSQQVQALSQQTGCTLFGVFLTAWATLLYSYNRNNQEIMVGSPMSKRYQNHTEQLIGYFTGQSVFRVDLRGTPTLLQLLNQTKQNIRETITRQDVTFGQVLNALGKNDERYDLHSRPYQTIINFISSADMEEKVDELTMTFVTDNQQSPKNMVVDINLLVIQDFDKTGAYFRGRSLYREDLFEATTVAQLLENFQRLLEIVVATPNHPIDKFRSMLDLE